MSEEFNWLDYVEPEESAPEPPQRSGRRRFLPRLPSLPRPSLPALAWKTAPAGFAASAQAGAFCGGGALRQNLNRRSATDLLGGHDERSLGRIGRSPAFAARTLSVETSLPSAESRQALYDVDDVLVTPEILEKPGGVISAVALSKAQQQQVELLRDIVGGAHDKRMSQADAACFAAPPCSR